MYLDLATFTLQSPMPPDDIAALETLVSGYVEARIAYWSAYIDARLRRLYAVPFATTPGIVAGWIVALVTFDCYSKRGFNPSSDQDTAAIVEPRTRALDELKEAADSQNGLFDLPLVEGADTSAGTKATPLVYTETDPYAWQDASFANGTCEGGGSIR